MVNDRKEFLVDGRVTYALQFQGKFYLVENVPARVNDETGEQFFAPDTVEKLQQLILSEQPPERSIETSVYDYPA